jgi:hypothetical protein
VLSTGSSGSEAARNIEKANAITNWRTFPFLEVGDGLVQFT